VKLVLIGKTIRARRGIIAALAIMPWLAPSASACDSDGAGAEDLADICAEWCGV
jgi:hypothetical protein